MNIYEIIEEEIQKLIKEQQWDDGEESLADKMYANRFGLNQVKQTQPQEDTECLNGGEYFGDVPVDGKLQKMVKNPKHLRGYFPGIRGVLVNTGDFYLVTSTNNIGHIEIINYLAKKGIVPDYAYNYNTKYPQEFVAVVRNGSENSFSQSTAYEEFPDYYKQMFELGNYEFSYQFNEYIYTD